MSNAAIYEELDEAIEQVMGGEGLEATRDWDTEVTELLPIAEELRMAARPEFRDALLVELTNASRFDAEEILRSFRRRIPWGDELCGIGDAACGGAPAACEFERGMVRDGMRSRATQ